MVPAIEGVGRDTLVIKGTEILFVTRVQGIRGGECASINFHPAEYDKYIAPLIPADPDDGLTFPRHKLVFIRFSLVMGLFLEHNVWPGGEKLDEWLEDVRIVDEFNFRWGLVPASFANVEGFGQALSSSSREGKVSSS